MDPLISRFLLFFVEMLFSWIIFSDAPWTSQDPSRGWAMVHAASYFVFGVCVLVCPWRKLVGIVCLVAAAWLPMTFGVAYRYWPGGNDGGGFFWIFIVFPMCFISFVSYLAVAASAISSAQENDEVDAPVRPLVYGVELTDASAEQIRRLRKELSLPRDAAVQLVPVQDGQKCLVLFDLPELGKKQWRGASHDIPILVDMNRIARLSGCVVDFQADEFVIKSETDRT